MKNHVLKEKCHFYPKFLDIIQISENLSINNQEF